MGQPQVKQFHGFGVVYPDGVSGVKVVRTYTQGPSKVVNPDGSVGYTTPPPTILELFGGGFAYADGSQVNNRLHLEMISDIKMRENALEWFDTHGEISEIAKQDIPPLDLEGKQRPDPVYVLSTDLPAEKDEVTKDLDEQVKKSSGQQTAEIDTLSQILSTVSFLAERLKEQDKQIAELKKRPPAPRRMAVSEAKHGKQSETMKARWANPEFKAKMLSKGFGRKGKGTENGKNAAEASKEVQK